MSIGLAADCPKACAKTTICCARWDDEWEFLWGDNQGQRYHEPSNTSSLKEQFISKAEAVCSFPFVLQKVEGAALQYLLQYIYASG